MPITQIYSKPNRKYNPKAGTGHNINSKPISNCKPDTNPKSLPKNNTNANTES